MQPKCGIISYIAKHLATEIKEHSNLQPIEETLFDEIKVQSGLVYSKQTGSIVGFFDMGDMNNEF